MMDTNDVKKLTGLTGRQLEYMLNTVESLKREKTQGKAREYSFRDLVFLKIAAVMRADGIRLSEINQAMNEIARNWGQRGAVMRNGRYSGSSWLWMPNMDLVVYDKNKKPKRIPRLPGIMYDVSFYAASLNDVDQMELNPIPEGMVQIEP